MLVGGEKDTSLEGAGRREAVWLGASSSYRNLVLKGEDAHTRGQSTCVGLGSTLAFPLGATMSKPHASLGLRLLICEPRKMIRPASRGVRRTE